MLPKIALLGRPNVGKSTPVSYTHLIAERRTQRQEEQEKVHARVRALRGFRRKHGCILKGWCGKRKYFGESRVVLNARLSLIHI